MVRMPPPCDCFANTSDLHRVTSDMKARVDFNQVGLLLFLITVVLTGSLKEYTSFPTQFKLYLKDKTRRVCSRRREETSFVPQVMHAED